MPTRPTRSVYLGRLTVASLFAICTTLPALAAGSNTTNPAPSPGNAGTFPSVNPGQTQVALASQATCAQQLTTIGLVLQGAGVATELGGTIAEGVAQAIPPPGEEVAEAAALATQAAGVGVQSGALANQIIASGLPNCDQEFTGTVKVDAGGVNVTGNSLFTGNVGVNGNVNVSGNVTASQVKASQGISADGGAIVLGDPNLVTYSSGITLGGGALSGAGFGGAQAFTGDVSAVAVGNGASAFNVNTVALGTNATAGNPIVGGNNSTAIGANTSAMFTNSAAFGSGATATRPNQQVFGTSTNNYTMPGLTSPSSQSHQSGPLQLPTTDQFGNLASDGGETFKAIARLRAGVAVALSVTPPNLGPGQKFGMRVGWGGMDGANAIGFSVMGVVAENLFSQHDRLTLDGGVGFGFGDFMGYRQDAVTGARAGMQLTW